MTTAGRDEQLRRVLRTWNSSPRSLGLARLLFVRSSPSGMFRELLDDEGRPYFTYMASSKVAGVNISETPRDLATFLSSDMSVSRRVTSVFSSDLTSHDDEFIAVLSLLLLLTIEAIVSTLLLRTSKGRASNVGFSVKHFIDLFRDFHVRHLLHGHGSVSGEANVNYGLLTIAIVLLAVTFVVEVMALVLTNPGEQPVTTSVASVGLVQPITPQWKEVRLHSEMSTSRPCSVLSLSGVVQGETRIGSCLSSNLTRHSGLEFEKISGEVRVEIVSDLHRFGAEHFVRYGEHSAAYSGRAYLTPENVTPGKRLPIRRIVGERPVNTNSTTKYNADSVYLIHKLYVAYLLTSYRGATGDETVDVTRLRKLDLTHMQLEGPEFNIIKINMKEEFTTVKATRFVTKFTAPNVGAIEALRYAQVVFRASIGLGVVGPDEFDLDMGSGIIERVPVILWTETHRTANWLTLLAVLVLSVILLLGLRLVLKPVSTADLAGDYVKSVVGADSSRSPLQLAETEAKSFSIGPVSEDNDYHYGAEIEDQPDKGEEEYD